MNANYDIHMSHGQGEPLMVFGVLAAVCCFGVLLLGLQVLICYLLYRDFKRIPARYRKQEPGLVWLLLIPVTLFQAVWNFFTFLPLAESLAAYFQDHGHADVGDAGRGLAKWFCIMAAVSQVPFVGCFTGPVALVLLIMVLLRFNELSGRIPPGESATPPAQPMV